MKFDVGVSRYATPSMTSRFVTPSLLFLANGALQRRKSGVNLPLYVDEAVFYRLIAAQPVDEDDSVKRGIIVSEASLMRQWH